MSSSVISVGILRETRTPAEHRVPLTPAQIRRTLDQHPGIRFVVQPSSDRCYSDEEYRKAGIRLCDDLSGCQLILGIKEVNRFAFIPGKTYAFFAHVAKQQPHNRKMMHQMIRKKVSLIDYEYITDETGRRLLAFGRWAGIIGAYNGIRAWGLRKKLFTLRPAYLCGNIKELEQELSKVKMGNIRILISGEGRVAGGAVETLQKLSIQRVTPEEFLSESYDGAVYCQVGPQHYTVHPEKAEFDFLHFTRHPEEYKANMLPYLRQTDLFLACHYWDPRSPRFFEVSDMLATDFRCRVIADISCDVNGPVPSTIRASSIQGPFYDFDPVTGTEKKAFSGEHHITVMAVDNLPAELPREASEDFGEAILRYFLPEYLKPYSEMIARATIVKSGELTPHFAYLREYAGIEK